MLTVVAALIGILVGGLVAAAILLSAVALARARRPRRQRQRILDGRRARGGGRSPRGAGRGARAGRAAAKRDRGRGSGPAPPDREGRGAHPPEGDRRSTRSSTELERREQGLGDREVHAKALQEELKEAKDEALGALERMSGLTVHEAKQQLLERSKDLVRHELARDVRQIEEEARADARRRARALVADCAPARRREPYRGGDGHRRRARLRRPQGPDHRSRGAQHPHARAPDRASTSSSTTRRTRSSSRRSTRSAARSRG